MSFIRVETETEIAKVTLDHPTGNRINFAMREELLQAFQRIADSKARVLVVRGKGTDFSLGGDVRDWAGKSAGNAEGGSCHTIKSLQMALKEVHSSL